MGVWARLDYIAAYHLASKKERAGREESRITKNN